MARMINGTKICGKCKTEYINVIENFSRDKKRIDGFCVQCKNCTKLYNLNNKNRILLACKIYREKNTEKVKKSKKLCYLKHIEKNSQKMKEYIIKNKETIRVYQKNFRSQKAKYLKHIKNFTLIEEIKCDENGFLQIKCTYCGK
jgi:hypothetical protein